MDSQNRLTIVQLTKGVYDHGKHGRLADRSFRRYHPFSFDFDSTPIDLRDPEETWDEPVKKHHIVQKEQAIERLQFKYGAMHVDRVVEDVRDLGPKGMSLIAYHNQIHQQARDSFVTGAYFPALVGACSLGERILNHLILDLRDFYKTSPQYKKVYRRASFDNWQFAVKILEDWKVLASGVGEEFLSLSKLRNRSIHFNVETYSVLREDALSALKILGRIIGKQFGYFGTQPWFIGDTPGAQFVKQGWETAPFVQVYIIPRSGFV